MAEEDRTWEQRRATILLYACKLGMLDMIRFYSILLVVSLLLFLSSLVLPSTHGIPIGRRLSQDANDWSFTFGTSNHLLVGANEEQSKEMLLRYFREHGAGDEAPLGWLTLAAGVASVLSFVGWYREIHWEKQSPKQ
ncbi:MAG TPA: hypothetical protein VKV04_00910 [Verrucomicrobiae bacterium]|nr:hypothetical protein [Verrucomicrobiae bacterium]